MSITKDFSKDLWQEKITGTGNINVTEGGSVITIDSPVGNSARSRYHTIAFAGDKLTFTCVAKNIPVGGLNGFAGIWIDIPIDNLINVQEVTSLDSQLVKVEAVVPEHLIGPVRIAYGVGSFSALDGSAEFINPKITRGGSHVVMEGFIEFADGGGFVLREDYLNYNVGTLVWNDSDKTLLISPSVSYDFQDADGNQFRPLLTIAGAPDGNTTEVYSWTGSCVNLAAQVKLQACTHAAAPAVPVNLDTSTNVKRFCGFRLYMVGDG